MSIRVVVANQSEARFYDADRLNEPLKLVGQLADLQGRQRDRDFNSDKPGRVFDHAPGVNKRRGAVAHHDTGGERSPHKHEATRFARRIAEELMETQREQRFEGIALVAGPAFLGLLRAALPKALRMKVVAEVAKDLLREPAATVSVHLPPQAFQARD